MSRTRALIRISKNEVKLFFSSLSFFLKGIVWRGIIERNYREVRRVGNGKKSADRKREIRYNGFAYRMEVNRMGYRCGMCAENGVFRFV